MLYFSMYWMIIELGWIEGHPNTWNGGNELVSFCMYWNMEKQCQEGYGEFAVLRIHRLRLFDKSPILTSTTIMWNIMQLLLSRFMPMLCSVCWWFSSRSFLYVIRLLFDRDGFGLWLLEIENFEKSGDEQLLLAAQQPDSLLLTCIYILCSQYWLCNLTIYLGSSP